MKVHYITFVLFIALVSENQSMKVHRNHNKDSKVSKSLSSQQRQVAQRQAANHNYGNNNVVPDPVNNNHNNGQQQVASNTQYQYGNEGQESSLNYYYPVQQQQQTQQPTVQPQQIQNQQSTGQPVQYQQQTVQPQQQQQQYYQLQQQPYYYPNHYQHQYQNFLYPDKTRRQGPAKFGQQQNDDGIFGNLFSGLFDMLDLSDDDDNSQDGHNQGWSSGGGDGQGSDGLGGIGGSLAGFIKGKKLGWLATGAIGLLFSPLILPLIALWVAAIVLIIYFIPIPVIDASNINNGNKKRDFKAELYSPVQETLQLARSVLQSDQCVERVSCEVGRMAKGYIPSHISSQEDWIQRKMDSFGNKWIHRMSRSLKTPDCKQYTCPSITVPLQKIRSLFTSKSTSSVRKVPERVKSAGKLKKA